MSDLACPTWRGSQNYPENWLMKWVSYCHVRCKMAAAGPLCRRGSLVGKPRKALVPAKHGKHFENPGRGGLAGQRHAKRLGNRTKLEGVGFRKRPHRGLGGLR